jgi:D-3-phosphoglycerate dehydrogenase
MSDTPRALVLAPFRGAGMTHLRELADVVYDPWIEHRPLRLHSEQELAARLRDEDASILICEADRVTGEALEHPLRVIGSTRGDPTNVDVPGATARGIAVLHTPGRNADAVAELTIGLILAATRGIVQADHDVRAGAIYADGVIPYQRFRGWELNRRTLGVVGYGAIGRAVAWRAEGLGMRVIATDPFAEDATHELDDLIAQADIVSLHAPVTASTVGMMDAERFAAMKQGAVFVNAARAALHDLEALTDALVSGHLAAAALDHFDNEHLDPAHPVCALPNVVLTPHIGGATYDTEAVQATMIADDIARLLAGERPVHIVNPEVLDA